MLAIVRSSAIAFSLFLQKDVISAIAFFFGYSFPVLICLLISIQFTVLLVVAERQIMRKVEKACWVFLILVAAVH